LSFDKTVLDLLRADALPWSTDQTPSQKIVDDHIRHMREADANGGFVTLGRGGWTVHITKHHTWSGYGCDSAIVKAFIAAGMLVIDTRSVALKPLAELIVRGPMLVPDAEADPKPWTALSNAAVSEMVPIYIAAGATVHNWPVQA